jgi:hypothetical protein
MMFKKKPTASKQPFTKAMLPHCRRELFFDVLKMHYIELISIGLVLFGFALPLIANVLITDMYTAQLSGSVNSPAADADVAQIASELASIRITSSLISIPLIALLFVGLAGAARIIRQYAWGEIVFPFRDFTKGIKQNIKQMLVLGTILGCVLAINSYAQNISEFNGNQQGMYVASAIGAVSVLFLLPIGAYMMVCISIYGNTFGQNFIQGYALFLKAPFKTLGMLLACFGVYGLWLIPNTGVHFWLMILGSIGMPILLLIWYLFVYNQLDQYVNAEKHPELVNKGIFSDDQE